MCSYSRSPIVLDVYETRKTRMPICVYVTVHCVNMRFSWLCINVGAFFVNSIYDRHGGLVGVAPSLG